MKTQILPLRKRLLVYFNIGRVVGVLVLLISLVVLLWGIWPTSNMSRSLLIQPVDMQPLTSVPNTAAQVAQPDGLERWRMVLKWPGAVRSGDTGIIRLDLEDESQPTLQIRPEQPVSLQETHNLVAEAHFDLPGVQIAPTGVIREPLRPGYAATFFWNIRPPDAGEYSGTLWLHLRLVPLDGGPENLRPLTAQRLEIRANSLLGMSGRLARVLGGAGLLLGVLLCFGDSITRLAGRFLIKAGGG